MRQWPGLGAWFIYTQHPIYARFTRTALRATAKGAPAGRRVRPNRARVARQARERARGRILARARLLDHGGSASRLHTVVASQSAHATSAPKLPGTMSS